MLGLIGFALLILACSYWKLSGQIENGGEETEDGEKKGKKQQYEEKVLVIMAGQVNPTFLATASSRTASFGDGVGGEKTCRCGETLDGGKQGNSEEEEEEQSGNRGGLGNEGTTPH
ncbi:Protein GLUTAMINE DUMPER 2 [Linum grandiflorum]